MNAAADWFVLSATAVLALPWHALAAEDAARALTLEEVIVTAQKRSENLQRTAAAVTAIAGLELVHAGVTDVRGALNFVPSVRFQAENASTEIYIRGASTGAKVPARLRLASRTRQINISIAPTGGS